MQDVPRPLSKIRTGITEFDAVGHGELPRRPTILHQGSPERQALELGHVDAVLGPVTGPVPRNALLPPNDQRALSARSGRIENGLLAALPREDYQSLLGELERVTLTCGEVLHQPGERIRHVYFPIDVQVSLLTTVASRKALEVGLVGREGMVGISLALGAGISPVRAVVLRSGSALRMQAAGFREALARSLELQCSLYLYAHVKLLQARQAAVCARFHRAEARVARWLQMASESVRSDQFHLTHKFLADILGIRRVGVTNAAGALQRRKLISYNRGNIRVLDHKGLKAAACECYEMVRKLAR